MANGNAQTAVPVDSADQDEEDRKKKALADGGTYSRIEETPSGAHDREVNAFKATLNDQQKAAFRDPLGLYWGADGKTPGQSPAELQARLADPDIKNFEATLTPGSPQQKQWEELKNTNPARRVADTQQGLDDPNAKTINTPTAGGAMPQAGLSDLFNGQSGMMHMISEVLKELTGGKIDLEKMALNNAAPNQSAGASTQPLNPASAALTSSEGVVYTTPKNDRILNRDGTVTESPSANILKIQGAGAATQASDGGTASSPPDASPVKISAPTLDAATSRVHVDQEITVTAPRPAELKTETPALTAMIDAAPAASSPTLAQWTVTPGGGVNYDASNAGPKGLTTSDKLAQSGVYASAFNDVQQKQAATAQRVLDPTAPTPVPAVFQPAVKAQANAFA